jgi:hypothetical protein
VKFVKRFLNFFVENHVEKILTLEVTVIVVWCEILKRFFEFLCGAADGN